MKQEKVRTVTFRPFSYDASQDFQIPADIARELFDAGRISIDATNGGYCYRLGVKCDVKQYQVR